MSSASTTKNNSELQSDIQPPATCLQNDNKMVIMKAVEKRIYSMGFTVLTGDKAFEYLRCFVMVC